MLQRRRLEAELLNHVRTAVREQAGEAAALAAVRGAVQTAARADGALFAAQAAASGAEPSLVHFATVVDRWRGSGVLDIEDYSLTDTALSFRVTRCGYVEMYRSMGLDEQLIPHISCPRDEPFAKSYSSRLSLDRPTTIAEGGAGCPFHFTWT